MRYLHTYMLPFEVSSSDPLGRDLDAATLQRGVMGTLAGLTDPELTEAVGEPYDTEEVKGS